MEGEEKEIEGRGMLENLDILRERIFEKKKEKRKNNEK